MNPSTVTIAGVLGVVQGLTEFIPVSSTGHLILVIDLLGFRSPAGKAFEIVIQLGSIFAVCWAFSDRLIGAARGLASDPESQRFARNILLAFLPAAVIGGLAHDFITSVLFNPWVVSVTLVLGGVAIILIERLRIPPVQRTIEQMPWGTALLIGVCQTVAMIPGVSRSGATIMGALLLGVDRRTATEFSFFLAIPTMLGATTLDLYKNWSALDEQGAILIGVGFVTAFISALFVVRGLIGFVSRHGFEPFAWYRIAVGALMLAILALA
ncbi:MAG: undecaprenyl-diphosphate phosphatase [Geminicoccaceae bacterium]